MADERQLQLDLRVEHDEVIRRLARVTAADCRVDVARDRFTASQRRDDGDGGFIWHVIIEGSLAPLADGTRLVARTRGGWSNGPEMRILGGMAACFAAALYALSGWFAPLFKPSLLAGAVAVMLFWQDRVRGATGRAGERSAAAAFDRLERAFADAPTLPATGAPPPLLPAGDGEVREYLPGESKTLFAMAKVPGAAGLRLEVERGSLDVLDRALGARDALVGDEAFDERFVVETNDVPFARAWLGPRIRGALLAVRDHVAVRLVDGELTLARRSDKVSPLDQQRIFELARLLAGRGRELAAQWQALAGALGGTLRADGGVFAPDGSAAVAVERAGVAITIDGWREPAGGARTRLYTRVRGARLLADRVALAAWRRGGQRPAVDGALDERTSGDAGFDAAYELRASADAAAWLTPALAHKIAAGGADRLLVDGDGVTLLFAGFASAADRLGPACELVAALACHGTPRGTAGPYR